MKVGIVGANSRVGTELCFLLREEADVVPIVRNQVAASTFHQHGFSYRVADVTDSDDARAALAELDVLVVTAFAPPASRGQFRPKRARRTNEALVRHSLRYSPPDATVIYCSTIAAFGEEIGRSRWWTYVREKRHIEETFSESLAAHDGRGYIFRLGLVFGPVQQFTEELRAGLSAPTVYVEADPRSPSNVVHTVTLMDAILSCAESSIPPGTYTLVNNPQWTWEEVVDRYAPDAASLTFVGEADDTRTSLDLTTVLEMADRVVRKTDLNDVIKAYSIHLPTPVLRRLEHTARRNRVKADIQEYADGLSFHMQQFDYHPAPGPFLPELAETSDLLDAEDRIDAFLA